MIQATEPSVKITGTMSGESVAMAIQAEAMQHIMAQLADLYSDRITAMLREYSTNARDAHVEAGNPDPIRVTLPGTLAPMLTIADQGTGLSFEDVRNVYSQYGASTKRDTNAAVGMLGFGCKCALAYSDSFTVTAVKDGRKITVQVARNAEGGGSMTEILNEATDEHPGVSVQIPIAPGDIKEVQVKAAEFFRYWDAGTVLVNGKAPERVEGLRITDDMILEPVQQYGVKSVIVMGGVPYPAPNLRGPDRHGYRLVAWVPIGTVDFPASRESLKMTERTKQAVAELERRYADEAPKALQRQIDQAANRADALRLYLEWRWLLGRRLTPHSAFQYKGQTPPAFFTARGKPCGPHRAEDGDVRLYCDNCEKGPSTYYQHTQSSDWNKSDHHIGKPLLDLASPNVTKLIVVHGYDRNDKPTATAKKKLLHLLSERGIPTGSVRRPDAPGVWANTYAIYVPTKPDAETLSWLGDKVTLVSWADVWAVKLPRAKRVTNSGRPEGAYDCYTKRQNWQPNGRWGAQWAATTSLVSPEDVDADAYYTSQGNGKSAAELYAWILDEPVLFVPAPRLEKFKRDIAPRARSASEAAKAVFKRWAESLTEQQRDMLCRNEDYYATNIHPDWGKLHEQNIPIRDPRWVRLVQYARTKLPESITNRHAEWGKQGFKLSSLGYKADNTIADVLKDYPLADEDNPEHTLLYINAVYAANGQEA